MNNFPSEIVCATSKAKDGNMDFRFGNEEDVIQNRVRFLESHNIAYEDHIAMRCDHTDIINVVTSFNHEVGARSQEEQIHSEVLVTQEKDLALMLFTADCQPVSFYDPVTQTIALAHISRPTLCAKLSTKTVQFLKNMFCVEPENLLVSIGPSIQKDTYAFPLPLKEISPVLENFITEKNGKAYIDLIGAHKKELLSLGIKEENLSISQDNTVSPEYFSYFRMKNGSGEKEARVATILMMKS